MSPPVRVIRVCVVPPVYRYAVGAAAKDEEVGRDNGGGIGTDCERSQGGFLRGLHVGAGVVWCFVGLPFVGCAFEVVVSVEMARNDNRWRELLPLYVAVAS